MRVSEVKSLFQALTAEYFAGADVQMSRQSRDAKSPLPLVLLTFGNVRRPLNPVYQVIDDTLVGYYLSRVSVQVDLFTRGRGVVDPDDGEIFKYEDTATEDMLAFVNFLNSPYAIEWSHANDVAISIDGDVLDVSAVINDGDYEYRSRLSVLLYFTERAIGQAGMLSEASIVWPTTDEDGNTTYTTDEPEPENTGNYGGFNGDESEGNDGNSESESGYGDSDTSNAVVEPIYEETSSGGGNSDLADETTGYFEDAEIEEDTDE